LVSWPLTWDSSAGDCARALPRTLTATKDTPIATLINRIAISQIR
jgi:hypothetical protein